MTNTESTEALHPHSGTPKFDVNILIVDDDPGAIQLLARILIDVAKLRFATNGNDALRLARESAPDLIVLDAEMPGMSGFQLMARLKADPHLADVPLIFITSHGETGFEVSALEMGAADFITKPFRIALVLARIKTQLRVKHMTDELRRTATVDGLTGTANRRQFDEVLEREWRRGVRDGDPMSLLLVEVDYFKLFNDRYGAAAADACLRRLAQTLASSCQRPADFLARSGGEEFMVLLPQTARYGAEHVARRMLDAVKALAIFHEDSPNTHKVSVSIGMACYDEASPYWENPGPIQRLKDDQHVRCAGSDLVIAADKALYSAQRAGRAQAKLCDIADVDTPELARVVAPLTGAKLRPAA